MKARATQKEETQKAKAEAKKKKDVFEKIKAREGQNVCGNLGW